MRSDLNLEPLLQSKMRMATLKTAYNLFIIVPAVMVCEIDLGVMGWESSKVVRFDLRPFRQGQTRIAKLPVARGLQCLANL